MSVISRIQRMGYRRALALASVRLGKKASHILYAPLWYLFKLKNLGFTYKNDNSDEDPRVAKEASIRKILSSIPSGSLLEIGIGEFPHFDRLILISELKISYTGCDFADVCESHVAELGIKDFDQADIRFEKNSTGTYSWTLFEMLERGEQFDVIYVDGHHTFYIDLPAILLADKLLKPGGYLLLDDIPWSLSFLKANMMRSLSQWYFYRSMYKFSDYTQKQQSLPHIKMIADELLVNRGGYTKDATLSLPNWWALRKKVT